MSEPRDTPDNATPASRAAAIIHKHTHEQQANLFQLLVEKVRDYALFVLDPRGHVATWNVGAQRIKGYRAEEIIGRHFSTFYQKVDVDSGKCERELEIATTFGTFEEEGWRVRKDGSLFWANVLITALRDEKGELVGFAKVTRDLTDRLRAEEERLQLVRAQESDKRKDEFLAIIGHELRNPLSPMTTALELLESKNVAGISREVDILKRQLSLLTRIVDDLMNMAGTLREGVQIRPEAVDICSVLTRAIDVSAPLIASAGQELEVDVPDCEQIVNVDVERMTQVFGNLLNNASKYTQRGGHIWLRAFAESRDIVVQIRDDGRGIEPHEITRVFDLFTQGEHGPGRRAGGLGVGLAVARQFVKRHGGEIFATSEGAGKGTTLTVRLPLHRVAETPAPSRADPAKDANEKLESLRVLVVDDNDDGAELMQAAIQMMGHQVCIAASGDVALELGTEFKPDVVFLDIGLPGKSGYEVVRAFRNTDYAKSIPIFAVTGYASASHRAEALRAGFTEHVPKPINLQLLRTMLSGNMLVPKR
ncbi:MAG: PAS domain-containing hybrid sensor histidine kinase/response regulator [Polyangiaceae bacterium]